MDCALCNEISNRKIVKENDNAVCFMCKGPLKDSHVLIIPIRHVEELTELNEKESKDLLDLCSQMQDIVKKVCKENEEPFLFRNYGSGITQPHIHFHVVPSKGALRDLVTALEDDVPYRENKSDSEMEELTQRLVDVQK